MTIFDKDWLITRLARAYPKSYINMKLEFIAHPQRNSYFRLKGVETEHQLRTKVIEYLSREAVKGGTKATMQYHLDGLNAFMETNFNAEEVETIYSWLGNGVNHLHALRFVSYGCDMRYFSIFPCRPDDYLENEALAKHIAQSEGIIPVRVFPGQKAESLRIYWDGKENRTFWAKTGDDGQLVFQHGPAITIPNRPLDPETDWELTSLGREERWDPHPVMVIEVPDGAEEAAE